MQEQPISQRALAAMMAHPRNKNRQMTKGHPTATHQRLQKAENQVRAMASHSYSQARQALLRPGFFETRTWKNQKDRADRVGAHPDILLFEKRFVSAMKAIGIPMFAHCVMRTNEEQQRLYNKGVSKALPGLSPHQHGLAVDIIHSTLAWNLPKPPGDTSAKKCWELIGVMGKEVAQANSIDIEWGGDWKFWDPAHWQIRNWQDFA